VASDGQSGECRHWLELTRNSGRVLGRADEAETGVRWIQLESERRRLDRLLLRAVQPSKTAGKRISDTKVPFDCSRPWLCLKENRSPSHDAQDQPRLEIRKQAALY
jgi:hypothetical protein